MILIILISIPVLVILAVLTYQFIQSCNPAYKLNRLERRSEEVHRKVIAQIERDIKEPYMARYNEYYLNSVKQKRREFIALKDKNKHKPPEEQLSIYQDWLNYLLSIYRPEYHNGSTGELKEYSYRNYGQYWRH